MDIKQYCHWNIKVKLVYNVRTTKEILSIDDTILTKNLVNKAQGVINRLKRGDFLPLTKKISLKFMRTLG